MRRAALLLLLAVALPAGVAFAHDHDRRVLSVDNGTIEPPASWGPRHDLRWTRYVMPTRDGSVVLLLTRDEVAVQFSDRTMRKIEREMERDDEDDDSVLGQTIRGAVLGGVRALLNRSLECPIAELDDVGYHGGRLELVTADGHRLFEEMEIDDRDLLESFRPQDARVFVEEFHRLKRGHR